MTSALMGFLLLPLFHTPILNSIFANIFAQPLVGFLITPLSLFLILGGEYGISLLDYSFHLLSYIAQTFSEPVTKITTSLSSHTSYLQLLICFFWSIEDNKVNNIRNILKK